MIRCIRTFLKTAHLVCRFSLRSFLFLLFLSFLTFFNASAKTVIIGSGSGAVSQTSMSGLSAGDVLAITPGTYNGATFANLTNVSIINNGGLVTFTGGWSLTALKNVTISGTGASSITYGFAFQSIKNDVFPLNGYLAGLFYGLRIYNCEFFNCTGNLLDAADNGAVYTPGDTSKIKLYKCTLANWKLHSCGMLLTGYPGLPKDMLDVIDSISVHHIIIDQTTTNGSELFAGAIYRLDCHDWNVNGVLVTPILGDVGMIVVYGNAQIHSIYRHGGRGYIARIWNTGLGSASESYFYNNIDLAHQDYGTIDTRCDNSVYDGVHTLGGNMHILNNTTGNLYSSSYTCPLLILGMQGTYYTEFRNNVGFNMTTFELPGTQIPIMNNNSNASYPVADSSNNHIFASSKILSVLADTVNCYLKAGSPLIDKGYTASIVKTDIGGIPRPQGAAYDIGAREYSSSASFVTANAGSNQTITLPLNSASLSGSGSTVVNSTISSYKWSETSGPNTATLSASTSVNTNATGLIAGAYVFSLKVKDANNDSSSASVTVTVNATNQPPVVSAGSAQTITLPTNSATLTGTATDILGISSYLWTEVSGPNTATIATSTAIKTNVAGLIAGTYVFQLKVVDVLNLSSIASVTITVKTAAAQSPVVSAGANQTITLPTSSVTLTGTASDASGTITSYLWTQVSGPGTATIATPSAIKTNITGLITGTYVFQLKATDNNNLSGTGTVTVTVSSASKQPAVVVVATASPTSMTLPASSTTLTATVTDGGISNTSFTTWWSKKSGPNSPKIASQPQATTKVTGLIAGTYVFYVSITDANGTATNTVTVTVSNSANNSAIAGDNQNVILPTTADQDSAQSQAVANAINNTAYANDSTDLGQSMLVYPNPTTGTLNLKIICKATGTLWVNVYDILGNIVWAHEYSKSSNYFSTPANVTQLQRGTYILRAIIDNKKVLIAKFIKQ